MLEVQNHPPLCPFAAENLPRPLNQDKEKEANQPVSKGALSQFKYRFVSVPQKD